MAQSSNIIILYDRIKELSRTESTGPMVLDGAATGFSSFGSAYPHSGLMYYAITDGVNYEVGSGQYEKAGEVGADATVVSSNQVRRYPFRSTNGDAAVNWTAGTKEVYVTYPAPQSVFTGSGVSPHFNTPVSSGIPFWESANILNYDADFIWDSTNNRLGLGTPTPAHALDIGGHGEYSIMRASGAIVGSSGVQFPSGNTVNTGWDTLRYIGGTQLEHFSRNELDSITGTNDVFQLSGVVDQVLEFKKQNAGLVLSGPPSGCDESSPGCTPAYPSFRALVLKDIPDLSSLYVTEKGHMAGHADTEAAKSSGVAIWHLDNVIAYDAGLIFDSGNNKLGIGINPPLFSLDVVGGGRFTDHSEIGGNLTVKGNLDIWGGTTYIDSTTVTVADKQLELASLSGTRPFATGVIDDAGIVVKATGTGGVWRDKEWIWKNSTDAWTSTSGNIDVSGIVGLTAGSGLSLTRNSNAQNLALHVTDVFNLSPNNGPFTEITQDDNIAISGVSGVNTILTTDGTLHTIWVDPSELSGILKNDIFTSWNVASQYDGTEEIGEVHKSEQVAMSGSAGIVTDYIADGSNHIVHFTAPGIAQNTASGIAISGWAKDYVDNSAGGTMTSWTVESQGATDEEAAVGNTDQVAFSGDHGIITDYIAEGSNHKITFSAPNIVNNTASGVAISGYAVALDTAANLNMIASGVAVSGYAVAHATALDTAANLTMIASGVAVSGWSKDYTDAAVIAAGSYTKWTVSADGSNDYDVNDAQVVNLLGSDGVTATYAAGTDHDITFKAPDIYTSGALTYRYIDRRDTAISGYLEALDTTANLTMIASGVAVSGYADAIISTATEYRAGSGLTRIGTGPYEFGITPHPSNTGLLIGPGSTSVLYINPNYMFADGGDYNFQLGYFEDITQGVDYHSNNQRVYTLGKGAGYRLHDSDYSILIGAAAGYAATGMGGSVAVGQFSAQHSFGCNGSAAVGQYAMDNGSGVRQSLALGSHTLKTSTGVTYTQALGDSAGRFSSGIHYTTLLGWNAGYAAKDIGHSLLCGLKAGYRSENNYGSISIGQEAGYESKFSTEVTSIGAYAGYQGVQQDTYVSIGYQAGYQAASGDQMILLGYKAGIGMGHGDTAAGIGSSLRSAPAADTSWSTDNGIGTRAAMNGIGIGTYALSSTTPMKNVIAIGYASAGYASRLDEVISIGRSAGFGVHDAEQSVFIGYQAGYHASGQFRTVAVGPFAASYRNDENRSGGFQPGYKSNPQEHYNWYTTDIGVGAGYGSYGTRSAVNIGSDAGRWTELQQHNICIGSSAGSKIGGTGILYENYPNATSYSNYVTAIGHSAAFNSKRQDYSVFIGYKSGYEANRANNLGTPHGQNISIIANGSAGDIVHTDAIQTRQVFNLANVVGGRHAGQDSSNEPQCVIGDLRSNVCMDPKGTLHTKPRTTNSVSFFADRSVDGNGRPLIATYCETTNLQGRTHESQDDLYSGLGNNTNAIVNKYGYLTLPLFTDHNQPKAALGNIVDSCGSLAAVWIHSAWYPIMKGTDGKWKRLTAHFHNDSLLD